MQIEFNTSFEDFRLGDELLSGEIQVTGDEMAWELGRVWAYAGNDGCALISVHEDLASKIRAHFEARRWWMEAVDAEHALHLPAKRRTPRLAPAYTE